jgi:RNA polymerase sigma-70 factor (ECF subfamily)
VRLVHDLDLAEECTQDAYLRALETWQRDGVPDRPGAWLTATARRRALDVLRRDAVLRRKLPLLVAQDAPPDPAPDDGTAALPDDLLRLVFTCCHPVLAREAQVALTLRLVCGLTTAEAAAVCLVSAEAMTARITRAKRKLTASGAPYRVPRPQEWPERLDAVLTVVHLVVTVGHTAPSGDALLRDDLLARGLHLARLLAQLLPDEPEVTGLLALCLLHAGRRDARTDDAGLPVLLGGQDDRRWDTAMLDEGRAAAAAALAGAPSGRFALQAALAAAHLRRPAPDWDEVVRLYARLLGVWDSPVVALNAAAALGLACGPAAGLSALDRLADDPVLARSHYLPSARAELLLLQGDRSAAGTAYAEALRLVGNDAERRHLERRRADLVSRGPDRPPAPP